MPRSPSKIAAYLEIGKKRAFAGAVDWPGWCRSGRDEGSALQVLFDYGPRYAAVLRGKRLGFGAPGATPSADTRPVDDAELRRSRMLLEACWAAFDEAVEAASGKELRKGPRGGGRDLDGIVAHVLDADAAYLSRLAWKHRSNDGGDPSAELARARQAILDAVASAIRGRVPARGPRGGIRWTPRYFVRRVAWHALDHAWEIEDRATS